MIILIAITAFVLCFAISPLSIGYARKLSLIDVANYRSSHKGVTPRGGGVVFILVFYLGSIVSAFFSDFPSDINFCLPFFMAMLMAFTGWLDDFKHLRVKVRFCIQTLVVAVSCFFIPGIWDFLPFYIEKTLIILAWQWFINLFNFMDGTDGYATQEAFFICLGLFILGSSTGNAALILGCSALGFLRVNYPEAKIFMGDAGSIFLGYILGWMLIYSVSLNEISMLQAAVLTSLFIFDATLTLLKRTLTGKKVWQPHREHWYQRLYLTGASHKVIFFIGVVYNLFMITLLVADKFNLINDGMLLLITICLLGSTAVYIKRREH